MELSKKCALIAESMTLAIDAKAKAMKAQGLDVVGFGAGEPDFDTPEFIKSAAKEALDKGLTKYTPATGTVELKKAICEKFKKQNNINYAPGEIVVSNGAKHSIFNAFAAILNQGDEVIINSPFWVTYPETVTYLGGVPVMVEAFEKDDFCPNLSDIEKAITKKTKAILVNSPSNPCGAIYSEEILRGIAELAIRNDLMIVSDEIYEELCYDGSKHFSIASISDEVKERTITINGLSKAYAMTGWRLGYTGSCSKVASLMGNLQSHATSNPNTFAQYAAVTALTGDRSELEFMVKEFAQRRKIMTALINSIDGISCIEPKGAFYVMMNISRVLGKSFNGKKLSNSMEFCDALLDAQNVALVPGIAFGSDNYCRLSYATSTANIEKGIERISLFVSQLV